MTTTADALVPDILWQAIQPLLPTRYGGRPRINDRAALAGIIYQLRTGVPWRLLPASELGCGSAVTCWRRLRDWQRAGVWQQLHHALLHQLGREAVSTGHGQRERARQAGGALTGPNPTDRGKPGSKYHLLVERDGIPLAVDLSAANTHDSMLLESLVDAVPPIKGRCGRPGRPRKRPAKLHGDKGYDYPRCRRALRRRGSRPGSPGAGSSRRRGWGGIAGWWSGCATRRHETGWR